MKTLRPAPATLRVVPRALTLAQERARALLDEAARECASLRERALHDNALALESLRREARAEAAALLAAERVALAAERDAWLAAQESTAVSLALEIARAVLSREAQGGESVVREVARKALAKARRARTIVLRVHPDELERVRASMASWLPAGVEPEVLAAEGDPQVGLGGVLLDTDAGRFDARLETQLALLERALLGARV